MIGSLIGAGLSAVGGIFGGLSASKAMQKVRKNLENQKEANEAWYARRYNEDATQRADAQRILTKTEERMRERNRQAAGTAAVAGGTDESVAATKAANAQAMAEAASQIAANADLRKDQIESEYQQKESQIQGSLNNLELQKAHAVGSAVSGVAQAGANIAGAF